MTLQSQISAPALVRKLWRYCNVLRDDGLSYPDYVEQLTYLLFLKMADERTDVILPADARWDSFASLASEEMHLRYGEVLTILGREPGILSLIFGDARNKIRDPAKLRLLVVDLVGETHWTDISADLKGDAYEGLLEKNARDTKSGAGQYFTPRPLVDAIVACVDPQAGELVCDPACGTGGFLLAAHAHMTASPGMSPVHRESLRTASIRGVELVQEVARLAAMNLFLHGIGSEPGDPVPISCADSLDVVPKEQVDVVLTNPPFGIKGSVSPSVVGGRAEAAAEMDVTRPDFRVRTANKQLNFLQHIMTLLRPAGRAAVVVPDNVLFEGGAAARIRRRLVEEYRVHTLLRLPPGLFYAAGVLANVLFFDGGGQDDAIQDLWVYDLRSDNHFSLKSRPVERSHLTEFVHLFRPGRIADREQNPDVPRWRPFLIRPCSRAMIALWT